MPALHGQDGTQGRGQEGQKQPARRQSSKRPADSKGEPSERRRTFGATWGGGANGDGKSRALCPPRRNRHQGSSERSGGKSPSGAAPLAVQTLQRTERRRSHLPP